MYLYTTDISKCTENLKVSTVKKSNCCLSSQPSLGDFLVAQSNPIKRSATFISWDVDKKPLAATRVPTL